MKSLCNHLNEMYKSVLSSGHVCFKSQTQGFHWWFQQEDYWFSQDTCKQQRANARNVSFRISLPWPIHIINPVDKTKLSCNTPHRRSTTGSLITYPLNSLHYLPKISDIYFWCLILGHYIYHFGQQFRTLLKQSLIYAHKTRIRVGYHNVSENNSWHHPQGFTKTTSNITLILSSCYVS